MSTTMNTRFEIAHRIYISQGIELSFFYILFIFIASMDGRRLDVPVWDIRG